MADKAIEIVPQKSIGSGTEGEISLATVTIERNNRKRSLNLVHKELQHPLVPVETLIRRYTECQKAGLPVPNTFRETDQGNILITDLSDNGKNIVISPKEIMSQPEVLASLKNSQNLANFRLRSDLSKTDQAKSLIVDYSKKAATAGLRFYYDCWFLVVKPDGSYSFVLGDFGNLDHKNSTESNQSSLEAINQAVMESIFLSFSRLQGYNKIPKKNT